MRVKVHFLARLRELAGRADWDCDVPPGASIDAVWAAVAAAHPALEPFRRSISCALNADFAPMSAEVRDGDEVAFLPPVSGGR